MYACKGERKEQNINSILKWISNPDTAKRNKVYYSVCMIYYLLQTINPRTSFKKRLVDLLEKYSHVINLNSMGFPANWKDDNFLEITFFLLEKLCYHKN